MPPILLVYFKSNNIEVDKELKFIFNIVFLLTYPYLYLIQLIKYKNLKNINQYISIQLPLMIIL